MEEQTPVQMEEVNWVPLLELRTAGTLNLEIQVEIKAQTQDSVEIEANGATSSHLVMGSINGRTPD